MPRRLIDPQSGGDGVTLGSESGCHGCLQRLCWCSFDKRVSRRYLFVLSLCVTSMLVCWVMTFAPMPLGALTPNFTICPRPTVCAEEWYTLALLAISRSGAYFIYPLMVLVFLSKANNLRTYLQRTHLSLFIPFHDLHHLHAVGGWAVAVDSTIHGLAHTIRWALQGNLQFFFTHQTGTSGLVAILLTPLIALPMRYAKLRKKVRWEVRKALHYLSIVWCGAILFHAPQMYIAYIMGIPLLIYLLDWLYGFFFRTHLVETPTFTRLESAVQLTFANPNADFNHAGYVLVNVPWLAKSEWHAFSLFRHPSKPNHSCVCMAVGGDWTRALHSALTATTSRPCWISGPFASPYSTSINYDNLICVASGIGITPALSIINAHKTTRRINLIWICRDAALLEFYLSTVEFDAHAWTLIFYTGKRQLAVRRQLLPRTVLVLPGRPQLKKVVHDLIEGIEEGAGLPEDLVEEGEAHFQAMRELDERMRGAHATTTDLESGREGEAISDAVQIMLRFVLLLTHTLHLFSSKEVGELLKRGDAPDATGVPHIELGTLTSLVADSMPEMWTVADLATLGDVVGGDDPLSLQLPCANLAAREIHQFAHEILLALQAARKKAHPATAAQETKETQATRALLASSGSAPGALLPDSPGSLPDEVTRLLMTSTQRASAYATEAKARASTRPVRMSTIDGMSSRVSRGGRKRGVTSALVTKSEKHGRNMLGILLPPPLEDIQQASRIDRALKTFSPKAKGEDDAENGARFWGPPAEPHRLRTWQMLYCGGAQPVVDSLCEISRSYGIKLRVEKFDW